MAIDKKKILLIQPRHTYAPLYEENPIGHIYMPTSLLAAASIFIELGIEVEIIDENIEKVNIDHNFVGINLLGAPYIPLAVDYEKRLIERFGNDFVLVLGGQIVSGLDEKDMNSLFTKNTINGNSYKNLGKLLGISENLIPKIEQLSLLKAYELIDKKYMKLYLGKEISFYLSQGCKHSCTFCSARRTLIYPEIVKQTEVYRNINVALKDFEYLLEKTTQYGIDHLSVYLSNLDLFQNPLQLLAFADGMVDLKKKFLHIKIELRGLSTAKSFLSTHKKHNFVIERMAEAGLKQVGFGIDGATYKVYKQTRKPQTVKDCYDVIIVSKEVYNIIPEILMVFGHNDKEDEEALQLALKFCKDMAKEYGAIPRPHIAKDIVPGNDGWSNSQNQNTKNIFLKNPLLFQNLDFTAVPSQITHPNTEFRKLVYKYYKKVCKLRNCLTQYVLAEDPNLSIKGAKRVKNFNLYRYDV